MRICPRCASRLTGFEWHCGSCGWRAQLAGGIPLLAPELAAASGGFDAGFYADLIRLEQGNFWFRARNRLILWALDKYFPGATSLLEVGCGTGFVVAAIRNARPGLQVLGSEVLVDGLVTCAQRMENVEFLQMDARHIPFRDEFDVVGAFDVLEHVDEDQDVLCEMHRALNRGGGILLTVPQHGFLWSAADEYAYHKRRYSRLDLRSKVEHAGFRIHCCTSFVTFLMPGLLASRVTKRNLADYDPRSEFDIPAAMNWTFERILDFERMLIRAGARLPFGGSLLLAASRA